MVSVFFDFKPFVFFEDHGVKCTIEPTFGQMELTLCVLCGRIRRMSISWIENDEDDSGFKYEIIFSRLGFDELCIYVTKKGKLYQMRFLPEFYCGVYADV